MNSRKPFSNPPHLPAINTDIRRPRRSDTAFSAVTFIDEPPFSGKAAYTHAPSTTHTDITSTSESRVEVQVSRDVEVIDIKSKTVVPPTNHGKDHHGWAKLAKKLGKHDKETIKGCNADIDTLLVFAGLFSAVLTAFVIETYKSLQSDPDVTSAQILLRITHQLDSFTLMAPYINASEPLIPLPSFQPPNSALRINTLWFSSLVISLVVASLGMFVKQWLRQYMITTCTSAEERVRIRHYRYEGLLRWGVFEICAALPLLLQLALVLFFIGLGDFLRSLSPVMGWFVTALIAAWLFVFVAGTMAPIFSSQCPYSLPFLDPLTRTARRSIWRLRETRASRALEKRRKYYTYPGDELAIRRDRSFDLPALIQADKVFRDDNVVTNILSHCLHRFDGPGIIDFTRHMLSHRLPDNPLQSLIPKTGKEAFSVDFEKLHTRAVSNSVTLLLHALHSAAVHCHEQRGNIFGEDWFHEGLSYIFATFQHCAEVGREIGYHVTHRQILDLHSTMLSGKDDQATRLWITLRLQYPTVPFDVDTLALDAEAIKKIVSVADELSDELSVSQATDYQHAILLQIMLEITLAVVRQYISQPLPSELDISLGVFQTFVKKTLSRLKRPSFSPKGDTLAVPRLLQIIEKLGATITSHHTSALDRLQQMLHDIRTTFIAPTRPQSAALSVTVTAIPTSTILGNIPEAIVRLSQLEHIRQTTSSSTTISVADVGPHVESEYFLDSMHVVGASPPRSERLSTPTDDNHSVFYGTPESGTGILSDISTDLSVHIDIEPPSQPPSPDSIDGLYGSPLLSPYGSPPPLPVVPPRKTGAISSAAFELLRRPGSFNARTAVQTPAFNHFSNRSPRSGQTTWTGVDTPIGENIAFTLSQSSLSQLPPGFVPLSYIDVATGAYPPATYDDDQQTSGDNPDIDSDNHPLSFSYPAHTRGSTVPLSLPEPDENEESSRVPHPPYDPVQDVDPASLPSRSPPPDGYIEYEERHPSGDEGQNILELEGVLEVVTGLPPAIDIE